MPQNPQNTIIQTSLKYYNQFRSVITEALRWLQITTDTKIKLKVETKYKYKDQQLLEFTATDVLKIEQQHPSSQDIITLFINPIINRYLNKHPMSWELINCRLLHPSDSFMKSIFHHQTMYGLLKHCPNKLNQVPCTIRYTSKMTNFPKGTTFDISNLQPG